MGKAPLAMLNPRKMIILAEHRVIMDMMVTAITAITVIMVITDIMDTMGTPVTLAVDEVAFADLEALVSDTGAVEAAAARGALARRAVHSSIR